MPGRAVPVITWVLRAPGLAAQVSGRWEAELAFAAELIDRDVRNNSAWNQRMFVLQHMTRPGGDDDAWLRRWGCQTCQLRAG